MEAAVQEEGIVQKRLVLSKDLKLPTDAVTQTLGILGKRGSGKTTTASVFAEELLRNELPLVIVDPTGAWWGLRSSADGKEDGYPITIIGGDHGDVPLEETAGKVLAELVAEQAPPLVLDLSLLSKSAARRFVGDFSQRLYEKNRTALHVIYDEADEFVPQRVARGMETVFGAVDTVVRRGRIRGLGVTLISQRSAAINKDVLSQCEVLVAHRASHPRDLDPVLEWMDAAHVPDEQLRKVRETIAALANGEAWVMSPEWLELFIRTQVRQRTTFNSSATPKAGERRVVPKRLAPVDLERLGAAMKEAADRQKANDPAALRRRIAELEREVAKKAPPPARSWWQ
jgi:DNA helicase HerA-like ATPase